MTIIHPYRLILDRSPAVRRIVVSLTSEAWSFIGLGCTVVAAVAGHFQLPAIYAVMLFCEVVCDTNDGYVYQEQERGIVNGYGLYLDHVLDAIAAALAAYGGYAIVGHPMACALGLTLYYLIAIHSWLYKITQLTRGHLHGLYYAVTLSKQRRILLNVDDLTIVMGVLVVTGWIPLLYVINIALLLVFCRKFVRTVVELRSTMWRREATPPFGQGAVLADGTTASDQ